MRVMKRVTNPNTRITIPMFLQKHKVSVNFKNMGWICYQTTGGSVSWRTMMNPIQIRMRDKLVRTIRQQTPFVFGQNGFGADMVSTARPAFMVFLDFTVLIPLALVNAVPLLFTLLPLKY